MRQTIETQLRTDANTDATFRAALIADPASAIRERYGVAIPDGVNVQVIEEGADEVVLVLPSATAGNVLTATELDAVAGADYAGTFTSATVNVTPG